ncbi:ABC transporter F family member 3 [Diplonema papillatum]|nr:ABC transporter F family member 3 [Diplonema papillatum]
MGKKEKNVERTDVVEEEQTFAQVVRPFDQKMISVLKVCVGEERLSKLDNQVLLYVCNILEAQQHLESVSTEISVTKTLVRFLLEFSCYPDKEKADANVEALVEAMKEQHMFKIPEESTTKRLLGQPVQLGKIVERQMKEARAVGSLTGLGLAADVNWNDDLDWDKKRNAAKEARKLKKDDEKRSALQGEFEAFMRQRGLVGRTHVKIHGSNSFPQGGEIRLNQVHISMGKSCLLKSADLIVLAGHRYGLIGRNGVGKTTLLRHIAEGELEGISPFLQILHIEQECMPSLDTPIQVVLSADVERRNLMDEEAELVKGEDTPETGKRLAEIYARMDEVDAHSAEARASQILSGLSFTQEMMSMPTKSLSGGWRMRVSLARALFISPDILLLDEPTNHLDLHAVLWLENYLSTWEKTLIVVSHSRTFLNAVVTDVIYFANEKLEYYRGDYNTFENARSEQLKTQSRQHEAQDKERKHIQEFIDKFRFNAKRAAMVQSRIKMMEKMDLIDAVESESIFRFKFTDPEPVQNPFMQILDVSFGYKANSVLFKDVNFALGTESRIALVGPNGAGKSTFMNVIGGDLEPLDGRVIRNQKARIARFTQHHIDTLNLQQTPIEHMMTRFPAADKDKLRAHLGSMGLSGEKALQPIYTLSGGQKSRISFAILTYTNPHMLLLDEPTNHLDIDTVDALIMALQSFKGGVLLISHDEHLITSVCEELWVCGNNQLKKFPGDFHAYKKSLKVKF